MSPAWLRPCWLVYRVYPQVRGRLRKVRGASVPERPSSSSTLTIVKALNSINTWCPWVRGGTGDICFHIYVRVCIHSQGGSDTYRLSRICRSVTADSPRYIWGFSRSSLPPPSRHWSHLSSVFWTAAARWSSEPASASEARENTIRAPRARHRPHASDTWAGRTRMPPIGRRPLPYIITGSVTQQKRQNRSEGWQRWHVRREGPTRWEGRLHKRVLSQ